MIQRIYAPGSEWLYLKIYTGTKSAEKILMEIVRPFTEDLMNEKFITQYFFIRYTDPDFHLRLRLRLTDKNSFNDIFNKINFYFAESYQTGSVRKTQIDTYIREVERYGENTMDLCETLFCVDSYAIVNMITMLNASIDTEKDKSRWLLSMILIDDMLDVFKYSLEKKTEVLKQIKENFDHEFGITTPKYYKPLNDKYREHRIKIAETMSHEGALYGKFDVVFKERIKFLKPIADEFLKTEQMSVALIDIMPSLIHMTMNRVFRDNNRMCEMVVYNLLNKYYTSEYKQSNKDVPPIKD